MPYKDKQKAKEYNTIYHRKWDKDHPDIVKASQQKYYWRNQEVVINRMSACRERKRLLWAGRTRSDTCEICGIECRTVLDHDHATGKFRGWLCTHCNTSLGFARDHTEVFYKMIDYLNKSRGLVVINQKELCQPANQKP